MQMDECTAKKVLDILARKAGADAIVFNAVDSKKMRAYAWFSHARIYVPVCVERKTGAFWTFLDFKPYVKNKCKKLVNKMLDAVKKNDASIVVPGQKINTAILESNATREQLLVMADLEG